MNTLPPPPAPKKKSKLKPIVITVCVSLTVLTIVGALLADSEGSESIPLPTAPATTEDTRITAPPPAPTTTRAPTTTQAPPPPPPVTSPVGLTTSEMEFCLGVLDDNDAGLNYLSDFQFNDGEQWCIGMWAAYYVFNDELSDTEVLAACSEFENTPDDRIYEETRSSFINHDQTVGFIDYLWITCFNQYGE